MAYTQVQLNLPASWQDANQIIAKDTTITTVIQKIQKGGGTHLAMTWPGPIAYFGFDRDIGKDVLPKFVAKKQIVVCDYSKYELLAVPRFTETKAEKEMMRAANKPIAEEIIAKFESDFDMLIQQPIKTIIIDTETELYEIRRFAEFGMASAEAFEYALVNDWFKRFMGKAEQSGKHIVLIQKLEDVYVNNNRTGDLKGKGFKKSHYLSKLNLIARRSSTQVNGTYPFFELEIVDSSQNPMVKGLILKSNITLPGGWGLLTGNDPADRAMTGNDQCNFQYLAANIFPGTRLIDWM